MDPGDTVAEQKAAGDDHGVVDDLDMVEGHHQSRETGGQEQPQPVSFFADQDQGGNDARHKGDGLHFRIVADGDYDGVIGSVRIGETADDADVGVYAKG